MSSRGNVWGNAWGPGVWNGGVSVLAVASFAVGAWSTSAWESSSWADRAATIGPPAVVSGTGQHVASGAKVSVLHTFVSSGDTILVGTGYKIAANVGNSTGSGSHVALGVKVTLASHEFRATGSGGHVASGRPVYRYAIAQGGGGHKASGSKSTSGFGIASGAGNHRARGPELIPLSGVLHCGPLMTGRLHVSPLGAKSMEDYLAIGATNVVRLTKLANAITKEVIANASVTATLYDRNGNPVLDATDIPVARVGSEYDGTFLSSVQLTAGPYTVRAIATAADGSQRPFNLPLLARPG